MKKQDSDALGSLKKGLSKFKEQYRVKGWEDDELHQKITESFEEFPWYKFNGSCKWNLRCFIWNGMLAVLIIYLLAGAILTHNRRWNKQVNDAYFDARINYQYLRLLRFFTLPIHGLYDLTKLPRKDCVIKNPLFEPEPIDCSFCEGVTEIKSIAYDHENISDLIADQEPILVGGVPEYENLDIGWARLRDFYVTYESSLDAGVCDIGQTEAFKKVSDYFRLTEEEIRAKAISIYWKNCASESTRYYRRMFKKPAYVEKSAEIYIEKWVFILHPSLNKSVDLPDSLAGQNCFVAQISGQSTFTMEAPADCHYNCTKDPMSAQLKTGSVVNFPVANWRASVLPAGDDWSILYLSTWQ